MLKIDHFHNWWGVVYMHETTKCVVIYNFLSSLSHCDACLEFFQFPTDYTIVLTIIGWTGRA